MQSFRPFRRHRGVGLPLGLLVLITITASRAAQPGRDQTIDFRTQIHPLLVSRCFVCHGPGKQEAGLRFDVPQALRSGGDNGPVVVPGESARSRLIKRVASRRPEYRMPPKGAPLAAADVQRLRAWIDQGAVIPKTSIDAAKHWAFQLPRDRAWPRVKASWWVRNPVDRFVLARLESAEMTPSPDASAEVRTRRLYLDTLGLVPPWEVVQRQRSSEKPDRFERLVDQVLASPRYGERWGRHWLDLARYADSTGYESDRPREIWLYRDWVIEAFNQDLSFDQFVGWQVAGDLYPDAAPDQRIATGFHCNGMLDPGVRWEHIVDRVNTTGAVFLGLTLGCAQCHDHKTDPLTQREFYQLYAFFNDARVTTVRRQAGVLSPYSAPEKQSPETPAERIVTTRVLEHHPQPTRLFLRGDPARPGPQVHRGFPAFLPHPKGSLDASQPLNRIDLARWLVAAENPLTARVTVNRIWQRLFGLGLVETENDFGVQTLPPSHPGLLDFLANRLQRPTWRGLKSIHRILVTSATYRQASAIRPENSRRDSRNRWVSRQRRMRLEAEVIRDIWLQAAGRLSSKIGGPSVFPDQVDGVLENRATPATWTPSEGEDRYRRGMYTWVWRLTPHPMLPLFDAPDGVTACTRRDRSNVPVQALCLLNDPSFVECAQSLAQEVVRSGTRGEQAQLDFLVRTCLARDPRPAERDILCRLLQSQRLDLNRNPAFAAQIAGLTSADSKPGSVDWTVQCAAWTVVARVVMNLDEFITRE